MRGKDTNKSFSSLKEFILQEIMKDAYARCCRSAPSSHTADNLNKGMPFWNLKYVRLFIYDGTAEAACCHSLAFDAFLQQFNSAFWQACHFAHYQRKTCVAQEYINLYSHWMTVVNTKESHCTETPFQIQFNVLLKLPS